MGTNMHIAALAAVAIIAAACGPTVSPTTAKSRSTATPETVRLVLETGVPSRPPHIALVVGDVVNRGVMFTVDWSTRRFVTRRGPRFPVPWPSASTIHGGDDATLAVDAPTAPDYVFAKTYAAVAIGSRTPPRTPIATYECSRFGEPRCAMARTNSGLRISLGRSVRAGGYLIVFCQWHLPLEQQVAGADPSADVTASWLFHVHDERPTRASRP